MYQSFGIAVQSKRLVEGKGTGRRSTAEGERGKTSLSAARWVHHYWESGSRVVPGLGIPSLGHLSHLHPTGMG